MDQKSTALVENVEGAIPSIPEKDRNLKDEATPLIPEKGGTTKDKATSSIPETNGSTKDEATSLIPEKNGNTKEEKPSVPTHSKDEEAACERMEVEDVPIPEQPGQKKENTVENKPGCLFGPAQVFYGVAAFLSFVFGISAVTKASKSQDHENFEHNVILAVAFFLLFIFFSIAYFYYARMGFNPAAIWGAASVSRDSSIRFRNDQIQDEDIENRHVGSSGTENLEATDKQQTACPSLSIRPSQSTSAATAKVSEIASAICQIASETAKKKDLLADGIEASTGSKEQIAERTVEHSPPKESDQEGSSSGELRRRKFPNQEDCKGVTNSSDEEIKKE